MDHGGDCGGERGGDHGGECGGERGDRRGELCDGIGVMHCSSSSAITIIYILISGVARFSLIVGPT